MNEEMREFVEEFVHKGQKLLNKTGQGMGQRGGGYGNRMGYSGRGMGFRDNGDQWSNDMGERSWQGYDPRYM